MTQSSSKAERELSSGAPGAHEQHSEAHRGHGVNVPFGSRTVRGKDEGLSEAKQDPSFPCPQALQTLSGCCQEEKLLSPHQHTCSSAPSSTRPGNLLLVQQTLALLWCINERKFPEQL